MSIPMFVGRILIEGKVEAKTGLRIGGSKEVLEVGGLDLPVIKDSFGVPYIPGSSLKGKMRALLELVEGKGVYKLTLKERDENGKWKVIEERKDLNGLETFWSNYSELLTKLSNVNRSLEFEGKPCSCGDCNICKLFGVPANANKYPLNPTRLIVQDAFLDKEHFEKEFESAELLEFDYTEVKYENAIDRLTSAANPRQVERVPAGARFNFTMSVKLLGSGEADLLNTLLTGMKLLEDDYLGGHGSRGYGAIEFKNLKIKFRGRSFYEGVEDEKGIGTYSKLSEIKFEKVVDEVKNQIPAPSEKK